MKSHFQQVYSAADRPAWQTRVPVSVP